MRRITAGKVRDLKPGDEIELKELKTGKTRRITLNKGVVDSINTLLESRQYHDDENDGEEQEEAVAKPD